MARAAAAESGAPNTALPATRMSAPAAAASGAVSRLMPPSISSSTASSRSSTIGAGGPQLVEHLGEERLAAEPGVHAHEEEDVDLLEVRQHRVERRSPG